jgi:murein DD-endopeptidase MepM/ murein hydrolase activator NlpD
MLKLKNHQSRFNFLLGFSGVLLIIIAISNSVVANSTSTIEAFSQTGGSTENTDPEQGISSKVKDSLKGLDLETVFPEVLDAKTKSLTTKPAKNQEFELASTTENVKPNQVNSGATTNINDDSNLASQTLVSEDELFERYLRERFSERIQEGRQRLEDLENTINQELGNFDLTSSESRELAAKIKEVKLKIKNFKAQEANIALQLEYSKSKVELLKEEIAKRELDLELFYLEREESLVKADEQKKQIHAFISDIQQDEALNQNNKLKSTLKLLFTDESLADRQRDRIYLDHLEKTERKEYHGLNASLASINEQSHTIAKEKYRLEELNKLMKKEYRNINAQKKAQQNLLKATRGEQLEYQKLWEDSQRQMLESEEAIATLTENQELIRTKLAILEAQKRKEYIDKDSYWSDDWDFDLARVLAAEDSGSLKLLWPVNPQRGITAYFRDPSYAKYFGVPHKAIDLRAAQGTPVHAPALGYVYKVADNGLGYSYIILAHKDDISTVYGHISEFMVEEGDTVYPGDIIGLSGGTPGTKGAGVMTTGAHLHFEVIKDGTHVNPLDYLHLEQLPIDYLPDEYLLDNDF